MNNDLYVSGQNELVKIHNNAVTQNGGQGSSGGGISLCTGADGYKVTGNFVCGNFNSGDGGGIGHIGLSNNGLIANNTVLFNQVFDQSRNDNGGGISIASETALAVNGLATGTGSVLVVNNTIQGNQAGSGNGGGISLSAVNGQDVASNPGDPSKWFRVTMVNNIVVDNMAALAGGGISLQDVALSAIVNDTVAHNDSTATAADAFSSPLKSASQSNPQIAGIVSHGHSAALLATLARGGAAIGAPATAPLYAGFSNPDLRNSVVFQNRSFYFRVDAPVNNLPTYSLQPPVATPNYSDLGVIGAAGPAAQLAPRFSLLTDPAGYASTNVTGDPIFHAPYFDHAGNSIQEVEPTSGIQIQPAFDEGGNYIDLRFGPLTQEIFPATNPDSYYNYVPKTSAGAPSPVVAKGDPSVITGYPQAGSDINGVVRTGTRTDIGAAQAQP